MGSSKSDISVEKDVNGVVSVSGGTVTQTFNNITIIYKNSPKKETPKELSSLNKTENISFVLL